MIRPAAALTLALALASTPFLLARTGPDDAQGQGRRGGGPPAPRGRSVTLGDVTAFDVTDRVVTISAGPDQVRVIFYRDDIFRLWLGPDGTFTEAQPDPADAQMVVFDGAPVAVDTRDAGDYWRIASDRLVLRAYKRPLRFALFDRTNTTVVWQETKPLTYGPSTVQTLRRGESEHFYGGGMQNGYFSHRDTSVNIRLNTRGWNDGATPNPAPFYMSTAGYGVFRNTMRPGRYDFLSPLVLSHDEPRFDAYYFYGPSLKTILDEYTLVTGRPFMLPRWGLEFGDADCYNKTGKTIDVVDRVARQYREHDMPGGWILPNDGYGCGYQELPETIAALKTLGFHTGLWTENGLERIATEVRDYGSRVMKLDVAWVGRGYQFALNGMRDAYQGIESNADSRGFVWTTCAWAGGQRYATIWSGDQSGNWEYIRFHIPTVLGAGLSGFNAATGDVDGIFGGSAQTQVRDLQWKALTPAWMIISGWSKQTNNMKQPWIFGEPYTSINRKYLKLKMRLTPYLYTAAREAYDTGVPAVRAMVLEFPDDPVTWSKRTQYQFMSGASLLVAPVYEDSPVRNDIYLPAGRWIDYWNGAELDGPTTLNGYAAPLDTLPMFVRGGAIIPMYPEMLYDGEKPADPVTLDVYPSGRSSFDLYEDDGTTQAYRKDAFARTLIEMDAPAVPDAPGDRITVRVGAARGTYAGMPASRAWVVEAHVTARPADVRVGDRALPVFAPAGTGRNAMQTVRDDFAAATEGWYFDPADRRGVVHVKIGPRRAADGFTLTMTIGAGS
ncbi:MAG: glycoside hydrolase family 31 protein [Vicinamibacterales bacterium]